MSYSYVKTVFPDFEYSNVYNHKLYSDMNGNGVNGDMNDKKSENKLAVVPASEDMTLGYLKSEPLIIRPGNQTKLIENVTFKEPFTQISKDKDNLHFYNQKIETFDGNLRKERTGHDGYDGHDEYIKHVSKCDFCKSIIKRQYPNHEMMELISYITFGIFILILLDTVKKQ